VRSFDHAMRMVKFTHKMNSLVRRIEICSFQLNSKLDEPCKEELDIAQDARPFHWSTPRACESVEGSIMRAAIGSIINGCHPCIALNLIRCEWEVLYVLWRRMVIWKLGPRVWALGVRKSSSCFSKILFVWWRWSSREFLVYTFSLILRKLNASCGGNFVCSVLNCNT